MHLFERDIVLEESKHDPFTGFVVNNIATREVTRGCERHLHRNSRQENEWHLEEGHFREESYLFIPLSMLQWLNSGTGCHRIPGDRIAIDCSETSNHCRVCRTAILQYLSFSPGCAASCKLLIGGEVSGTCHLKVGSTL